MPIDLESKQIEAYGITRQEVKYKEWYKRLLRNLHLIKPKYEIIRYEIPTILEIKESDIISDKIKNFEKIKQSRAERPITNDK